MVGAVASGALAVAATLGAAPSANASCASFFGIGNSAQCTSALTSIAIAIGTGATATAANNFTAAIAIGNTATANTDYTGFPGKVSPKGAFLISTALGDNSVARTGSGYFQIATAVGHGADSSANLGTFNTAMAVSAGSRADATGDFQPAPTFEPFGGGMLAVVLGHNSTAIANGGYWWNRAIVIGSSDSAVTQEGNFNRTVILGNDSSAQSGYSKFKDQLGNGNSTITIGNNSATKAMYGNRNRTVLIGNDSTAESGGAQPTPETPHDYNDARATVIGNKSAAYAKGDSNRAFVVGQGSYATAGLSGGNRAAVIGNNSTATAGPGTNYHILVKGNNATGAAPAAVTRKAA